MPHACLILLFASFVLAAQGRTPARGLADHLITAPWAIALATGLPACWLVVLTLSARWADRQIERTGSLRPLRTLERAFGVALLTSTLALCAATVLGPWLSLVRARVGDLILIDEALAAAPVPALIIAHWAASYPIARRLAEAVIFRQIDSGLPVHAIPTRWQFVSQQTRHQLLILLVPMAALWTLGELQSRAINHALTLARRVASSQLDPAQLSTPARLTADLGLWLATSQSAPAAILATQVLGALCVIVLTPLVIRRLWRTTPLTSANAPAHRAATHTDAAKPPEPPLAQDLLALAAEQRVRVARVLIWQTRGTTVNGAVLGVVGRFRYILLTDALLERLPRPQVLAVMAHELGHVRLRHIPWLAVTLFAASSAPLLAFALFTGTVPGLKGDGPSAQLAQLITVAASLAFALWCFGLVSRRFEWQADAFAARALSQRYSPSSPLIDPQAAHVMAQALASVADHSGLDRRRFGFRHGSIQHRIDRLAALAGAPLDALPIDRTARRIKHIAAAGAVLAVAGLVLT